MEEIYYLNHDCMQNFEMATIYIYSKILLTTKEFFSRINIMSAVRIYYNHSKYTDLEKFFVMPIFSHITNLDIKFDKLKSFVHFQHYIKHYVKKYASCPNLQRLTIQGINHSPSITEFKNLAHLNVEKYYLSSRILNEFKQLTFLKLNISTYQFFHFYTSVRNLRILDVTYSARQDIDQFGYKFINLQKLALKNLEYDETIGKINFPCLTYLKITGNDCEKFKQINFNIKNSLKCLILHNVDMNYDYFENANELNELEIYNISNKGHAINLSNENLTSLKLKYFETVKLRNMHQLKIKQLENCKCIDD